MSGWRAWYRAHLCTAEEAVAHILDGAYVSTDHAAAEPRALLRALVVLAGERKDITLASMLCMGEMP